MIKLKKLLKESSPGFTKREFGDPLPTFKDVMGKHQQIEEFLDEGLSREYRLREKSGTGVPKKYKQEVHKTLDKIWKKFKKCLSSLINRESGCMQTNLIWLKSGKRKKL